MAKFRNLNAPASAPGGYVWDTPDDVVEIPDALAEQLLKLPHGGWREVLPDGSDIEPPAPTPGASPVPVAGSVATAPGSLAGAMPGQPDPRAVQAVPEDDPEAERNGDDADEAEAATEQGDEPFSPADYTADEVLDYLREDEVNEAEAAAILDAEAAGKNRKGIVSRREELLLAKRHRAEQIAEHAAE